MWNICQNCKMYWSNLQNVCVQSSCQLAHHGACELVFYWGKICYEARFLLNGLLVQLNFYICNSISGLSTSIWLQHMSFNICEHEQGGSPEAGRLIFRRETSLTAYLYLPISHSDNFQTAAAPHDHIFVWNDAPWSNRWLTNFSDLLLANKYQPR